MKILIIEDELAILDTLQEMLELNGHIVIAAADGITGAERAVEGPDLILCDYITNPFTEREIIDAIQASVHRQQPLREVTDHKGGAVQS